MNSTLHRFVTLLVVLAPTLAFTSEARGQGAAPETVLVKRDAFYDPPADVPKKPGVLIRSEPLTDRTLPAKVKGWRILYTTEIKNGTPAISGGVVLASTDLPSGPRPVLLFEHDMIGTAQRCQPSLYKNPASAFNFLDGGIGTQALDNGWVIVATDYAPFRPEGTYGFFIGEAEARSGFDSVRAARQIKELTLDKDRTIIAGQSQGGHSALWTGALAERLGSDVKLSGVVAFAPVTDVARVLMDSQWDQFGWLVASYLINAWGQFYRDIKPEEMLDIVQRKVVQQIVGLCSGDPADAPLISEALKGMTGQPLFDLAGYAISWHLVPERGPTTRMDVPLLIVQGTNDSLVHHEVNDDYVMARCAAGQRLDYWKFTGLDHQNVTGPIPAPQVFSWMQDRLERKPLPKDCENKTVPPASH